MPKKRQKPDHTTPTKDTDKRTKENPPSICPVCNAVIIEDGNDVIGDDAVYCEGTCDAWMHRKCVGMSKTVFDNLSGSNDPYLCPTCIISKQSNEIAELKNLVKSLTSELSTLKNLIPKISELENKFSSTQVSGEDNGLSEDNSAPLPMASSEQPSNITRQKPKPASVPLHNPHNEKKFEVVVYGIQESPPKTPRSERLQTELQKVSDIFSSLDGSIQSSNIKDLFRLGKYSPNQVATKPRPILVKFLRSTDASSILYKKQNLKSPIAIKPNMSKEEQLSEQILLKQRWQLTQQGVDRKQIKIRQNCLYVNDTIYAKVLEGKLVQSDLTAKTHQPVDSESPQLLPSTDSTPPNGSQQSPVPTNSN